MYIVDGYNVLHALSGMSADVPREFGTRRRFLMDLLAALAAHERRSVAVFFDGTPGRGGAPDLGRAGVRLIFTGGEADGVIKSEVANAHNTAKLTVVTSDRDIASSCRGSGAHVIASEEFVRRLTPFARGQALQINSPQKRRRANTRNIEDTSPISVTGSMASSSVVARPVRKSVDPAMYGEVERQMAEQVGDIAELEREALQTPLPPIPRAPERRSGRRRTKR